MCDASDSYHHRYALMEKRDCMRKNIDGIIKKVKSVLKTHEMGTGKYARWIWQNESGNRDLSPSEYGCADAANILYTIGEFIKEPEERAKWVESIQSFQNPETGLFSEPQKLFRTC